MSYPFADDLIGDLGRLRHSALSKPADLAGLQTALVDMSHQICSQLVTTAISEPLDSTLVTKSYVVNVRSP